MYRIRYVNKETLVLMLFLLCLFSLSAQQKANNFLTDDEWTTKVVFLTSKIDTVGVSNKLDCLINIFSKREYIKNLPYRNRQDKEGLVMHYDTLGYNVRILFAPGELLLSESYLNSFLQLQYVKGYNEGVLDECGFYSNHQKVGVWKYRSSSGGMDSIVNYEENRIVSFCEFFEIAQSFGMVGKGSNLPGRQEFQQIANANNLTIYKQKKSQGKNGWPSLSLIDQKRIEKEGCSNNSFYYQNDEIGKYWSVSKFLNDGDKRYGYGITVDLIKSTIHQYELRVID